MTENIVIPGITFEGWPKTPRLNKAGSTIITEKIDGTNACVVIMPIGAVAAWGAYAPHYGGVAWVHDPTRSDVMYLVGAQSRNRLIYPSNDNAGFAQWVFDNADRLVELLGPGRHFGEWWGKGIQKHKLDRKVFSLFNSHRWDKVSAQRPEWEEKAVEIGMDIVPVLYKGAFSNEAIQAQLDWLRKYGSMAASNWGLTGHPAEGVIIYHQELKGSLKAFVDGDDTPKSLRGEA